MKLEDYKPEILYLYIFKNQNKIKTTLVNLDWIEDATFDKSYIVRLPFINYYDSNKNRLFLFDILIDDKNNNYYMIIYHKRLQFIAIDLKYKFNADNTNYQMWYAEIYYKRVGSIYELPNLQKQFNIEV